MGENASEHSIVSRSKKLFPENAVKAGNTSEKILNILKDLNGFWLLQLLLILKQVYSTHMLRLSRFGPSYLRLESRLNFDPSIWARQDMMRLDCSWLLDLLFSSHACRRIIVFHCFMRNIDSRGDCAACLHKLGCFQAGALFVAKSFDVADECWWCTHADSLWARADLCQPLPRGWCAWRATNICSGWCRCSWLCFGVLKTHFGNLSIQYSQCFSNSMFHESVGSWWCILVSVGVFQKAQERSEHA